MSSLLALFLVVLIISQVRFDFTPLDFHTGLNITAWLALHFSIALPSQHRHVTPGPFSIVTSGHLPIVTSGQLYIDTSGHFPIVTSGQRHFVISS